MPIPEYSNLKVNLSSMNQFFNDNGVKLSESEKTQIKNIFDESNTQKETDKNVEEQLTGNERVTFLEAVKKSLPNIYNKIVDFIVAAEVVEDLEKTRKETIEQIDSNEIKNTDTKQKVQDSLNNFGLM